MRRFISEKDEAEKALENNPAWVRFDAAKRRIKDQSGQVSTLETSFREAVTREYDAMTNPHPHGAVRRVEKSQILRYNDSEALKYCREHLPQALKFIKREFEKVAKIVDLEFVSTIPVLKVAIKSDLSEWEDKI
jgi:hypothetical protein